MSYRRFSLVDMCIITSRWSFTQIGLHQTKLMEESGIIFVIRQNGVQSEHNLVIDMKTKFVKGWADCNDWKTDGEPNVVLAKTGYTINLNTLPEILNIPLNRFTTVKIKKKFTLKKTKTKCKFPVVSQVIIMIICLKLF